MNYAHLLASIFALFTILGALAIVGTFTWFSHEFRKPGPLPQNTVIEIASGSSLAKISDELLSTGAISHALVFKIGVRIKGDASALKAGEYQISSAASMHDIMQLMQNGKTIMRSFTIPEGKTSYEIVRILNAVEGLNGEVMEVPAEGSLLPETYHFQKGDTRAEKIVRMQSAMKETVEELWPGRDENLPFETKEEAITLASIVEKETAVTEERAKVAGVFINRLRRGIAPKRTQPSFTRLQRANIKMKGKGHSVGVCLKKIWNSIARITPTNIPACRPAQSPIRAAPPLRLSCIPKNMITFISSQTARAVMPLVKHSPSIMPMSRNGAKSGVHKTND